MTLEPASRASLVEQALEEAEVWRRRWSNLRELSDIFTAIERLRAGNEVGQVGTVGRDAEIPPAASVVRARQEHLAALRSAATRIAPGHITTCAVSRAAVWSRKAPCTCGLDALRDAVATMEGSR